MPIITIEMTPQDYEKKTEIARVFTDELSRITGIPKQPIVVLFHDLAAEQIATAGEMLSGKSKQGQPR